MYYYEINLILTLFLNSLKVLGYLLINNSSLQILGLDPREIVLWALMSYGIGEEHLQHQLMYECYL
jgi:hypothetical protein